MNQIELAHQRLADADGLPAVLAASWEIFELIAAIASVTADNSPDLYPAFTFARGSAIGGRNTIAFAPSMPAVPVNAAHSLLKPAAGLHEIADALAGLASSLGGRLRDSAGLAPAAADRSACEDAASEAERIAQLLARGLS